MANKVIAWLLLLPFFLLLVVVLAAQWATWLVEFPLLLIGLQILKAYPLKPGSNKPPRTTTPRK